MNAKFVLSGVSHLRKAAERSVSYLPLNHIAAQIFDVYRGLESGTCIYFADQDALKGSLTKIFAKARPTCIFGVPRVFEKMQERLKQLTANSSRFSRCTLDWARQVTLDHYLSKSDKP